MDLIYTLDTQWSMVLSLCALALFVEATLFFLLSALARCELWLQLLGIIPLGGAGLSLSALGHQPALPDRYYHLVHMNRFIGARTSSFLSWYLYSFTIRHEQDFIFILMILLFPVLALSMFVLSHKLPRIRKQLPLLHLLNSL